VKETECWAQNLSKGQKEEKRGDLKEVGDGEELLGFREVRAGGVPGGKSDTRWK